jgi:hypothetical protein
MPTAPAARSGTRCGYCAVQEPAGVTYINLSGTPYCPNCATLLTECPECHRACWIEQLQTTAEGVRMCSLCFRNRFFICVGCNATLPSSERCPDSPTHGRLNCCVPCFERLYTVCSRCRRLIERTGATREVDGDATAYCTRCWQAHFESLETTYTRNKYERRVGIEIEFVSEDSPTGLEKWGRLKGDGSVHALEDESEYGRGHEFASFISRGDTLWSLIDSACESIELVGGFVNRTCGLHVHLDMTDSTSEERDNISKWWCILEPTLFGLVEPARRSNQYCRPLKDCTDRRNDRYRALNMSAFSKHHSFEIRLHHGSIDPDEIKAWVGLLLSFFHVFGHVNATATRTRTIETLPQRSLLLFLFQQLDLPLSLRKDIVKRARRFNNRRGVRPQLVLTKSPKSAKKPVIPKWEVTRV